MRDMPALMLQRRCNSLENPIGIETQAPGVRLAVAMRCNSLENPIGIETSGAAKRSSSVSLGCNSLENPIGIETANPSPSRTREIFVATHWKTR